MEESYMSELTSEQAYAAMVHFLEEFWKRTQSDGVGMLLSDLSLLLDGTPGDPAVVSDWQEAVEYALKGGKAGSLELR
ncbi:MAG: hypothetical protein JST22_03090 [Bacteroidetes bacterium]|nr:hypothetical protein [Bacteroidota bacterium]